MDYKELIERLRDENNCDVLDYIDDAATAIETLLAEREAAGWVDAKDRQPTEYRTKLGDLADFLVWGEGSEYARTAKFDGVRWWDGSHEIVITHWMPFPAPPMFVR